MLEKVTSIAKGAAGSIKNAPSNFKKGYKAHKLTISSVKQVDENVFMLDYNNDYKLEKLLEQGCKSLPELLKFAADNIFFGVNIFKAQPDEFGCTTFNAFTPDGDHLMGRNFDYKSAPCLVLWTHPENGYASLSMVDCNFMIYGKQKTPTRSSYDRLQLLLAPYCTVDGINEKGLSIAVVEIKTSATNQTDPAKPDLTTTSMIRVVLDLAATCDEAIEIFRKYNMHDSVFCNYHYQISDASGKTVIIEYVNNEMRVLEPSIICENGNKCQAIANYYISEDGDNRRGFGYDRGKKANEKLASVNGILDENQAMELLDAVHLNYKHEVYPWQVITLWSSVYNCTKSTMTLCAGLDYSKKYRFSVAEPCEVK